MFKNALLCVQLDRLYQALQICTFNEKGVFVFKQVLFNERRAFHDKQFLTNMPHIVE